VFGSSPSVGMSFLNLIIFIFCVCCAPTNNNWNCACILLKYVSKLLRTRNCSKWNLEKKPHRANTRELRTIQIMSPAVRLRHLRFGTKNISTVWCLLHRLYNTTVTLYPLRTGTQGDPYTATVSDFLILFFSHSSTWGLWNLPSEASSAEVKN
jgi:hypothetical protein